MQCWRDGRSTGQLFAIGAYTTKSNHNSTVGNWTAPEGGHDVCHDIPLGIGVHRYVGETPFRKEDEQKRAVTIWQPQFGVHVYIAFVWLCLHVCFFTARRLAKRGICRRRVSVCLSVCVCVCVSVTLRYCIKTVKRRITQITPHDSPFTLVFWHQSSLQNSNRITPYGGDKCSWGGLKFVTFDENRAITRKRYEIDA